MRILITDDRFQLIHSRGMQWLMFVLMFICTSVSKMKNFYWEGKKIILYLLTLWMMSLEVSPTGT